MLETVSNRGRERCSGYSSLCCNHVADRGMEDTVTDWASNLGPALTRSAVIEESIGVSTLRGACGGIPSANEKPFSLRTYSMFRLTQHNDMNLGKVMLEADAIGGGKGVAGIFADLGMEDI